MIVKDLMDKNIFSVKPDCSLPEAFDYFRENKTVGACVVTDDDQIAGFITEGDFIRATIPSATDLVLYESIMTEKELPEEMVRNLRYTKVEDIMSSNVICVNPEEPILNALALMHVHNLKRLPVVESDKLVGTIARGSILQYILLDRQLST